MKKTVRKQKIIFLSLIATVIIIAVSIPITIFLVEKSASEKTYPLGTQLEYIGKTSYGCWLICDANPASIYYYKTDMDVKEVVQYFKKASVRDDSDLALTHPPTEPIYFSLQATTTNNPISVYYYVDGSQEINSLGLAKSNKKHLVTIPSEDYQAAKDAL